MYKVSTAYKKSMKDSLRNRSFMMISFGLINQEAQAHAKVEGSDFAYFSHQTEMFGQRTDDVVYATLETDFTKVDGSMYFLPRESMGNYYDTGLISKNVVPTSGYELLISLNVKATDIKGLTINFGEAYAVDFDICTSSGGVIEIRGNEQRIFTTEEVMRNTTYIKLIFYTMRNPYTRLRIYSIQLGIGLVYYNEKIMDSQLDSYISPICADVPQIDFMVKLANYDHYFNVDNPNSAINFLETGQEMYVYYGYNLDPDDLENIEWVKGAKLECSEWESDDYSATIRCQDIFRSMDVEYYKGVYNQSAVTFFQLAETIFQDAGIEDYYIDPYLKKLRTNNPIPRVKHKEALQIIANACRCVLSQDRNGKPRIKASFEPEYEVRCNGEMEYSNIANIRREDDKDEYATLSTNYTTADGKMYFLPRDFRDADRYTGYVSRAQSDENGYFTENPMLIINQESACMYYGLKMVFGQALPAEIIFRTYNDSELVEEYTVTDDIVKNYVLVHDFDDFDYMEVEFVRTAEPFNRIVINYFAFGDISEFKMERFDMTSSPKAIKQELIKQVQVVCYSYQKGLPEETLVSEETEATAGDIVTYYLGNPSYDRRATFGESTTAVTIIDSGAYFVTVRFNVTQKAQFEVFGYRYNIVERYATKQLNNRGKTIKWENPLISNMETANKLVEWLADYYNAGIEYEYTTRGNPEIDANDIIYQENEFRPDMKVMVYRHTVGFQQALSGKVSARRYSHTK